jgi:hypothetical protein
MSRYNLLVFLGALPYLVGRFRAPQRTDFAVWLNPPRLVRLVFGAASDRLLWDIVLYELAALVVLALGVIGWAGLIPPFQSEMPTLTRVMLASAGALVGAGFVISLVRTAKRQ